MATKPIILPDKIDLERFLSVHAHDIRTPFNHITGFSKMLLNTLDDAPLSDLQKEDLGTVYRSGMRALDTINGLINIARFSRGEKELSITDANIQTMIERSIAQWKKFHPGTDTLMETRLLATSGTMNTDELLFQQLLVDCVSYVGLFCESQAKVNVTVEEEANRFIFTFSSFGLKARMISELDLEMVGFITRTLIELHGAEIRRVEENDTGALIQFSLPKK
jgi:K+-sensing histidine kinase KdpD